MTLDIKDRLYTSSEVAEILGVSLRSVYRYLEEGKLDADIKTATGRHRFSRKNILDFLQPSDVSQRSAALDSKSSHISNSVDTVDSKTNSFSPTDTIEDEFDFDNFFETEIVKTKEDSNLTPEFQNTSVSLENEKKQENSFLDEEDDLEKLFEELEKEFTASGSSTTSEDSEKKVSKLADDEFDFDFDFLEGKESVSEYLNTEQKDSSNKEKDDEFDFDFLESFFEDDAKEETKISSNNLNSKNEEKETLDKKEEESDFMNLDSIFSDLFDEKESKDYNNDNNSSKLNQNEVVEDKKDDSESWLEKFRKASEKVSEPKKSKKDINDDFDLSSFFNSNSQTSSIATEKEDSVNNDFDKENDFKLSTDSRKKEYYYISSLSGPKEIAQTIDKVSRKFDLDYAFTLNAGLSLHKDISPFTLINVYINERDLEIFEDYLKLTPSSDKDAHICLMMAKDREIFEDSYELNGLFVVSNVQLRSDFIDKGMDNYAREV